MPRERDATGDAGTQSAVTAESTANDRVGCVVERALPAADYEGAAIDGDGRYQQTD